MKFKNLHREIGGKFALIVALAALSNTGFAASSWSGSTNFQNSCTPGTSTSGVNLASAGSSVTCGAGNPILTGYSTGKMVNNAATAGNTFNGAAIWDWQGSGLGVVATNESTTPAGPHAVDSVLGTDALLLDFGGAVTLSGVQIGWSGQASGPTNLNGASYKDSDMTVLAWTGDVAPNMLNMGLTTVGSVEGLIAAGWVNVGNFSSLGTNATANVAAGAKNTDGSVLYSSYWLISAYNSNFGGSTTDLDNGDDSFKVLSIAGSVCDLHVQGTSCVNTPPPNGVPEPGSMALMGLALVGLVVSRSCKTARHAV